MFEKKGFNPITDARSLLNPDVQKSQCIMIKKYETYTSTQVFPDKTIYNISVELRGSVR